MQTLYKSLGWNVVILLFYLPGSALGAFAADYWGPKYTLAIGVCLQAIFGFIMSGLYEKLTQEIGAFVVMCIPPVTNQSDQRWSILNIWRIRTRE